MKIGIPQSQKPEKEKYCKYSGTTFQFYTEYSDETDLQFASDVTDALAYIGCFDGIKKSSI